MSNAAQNRTVDVESLSPEAYGAWAWRESQANERRLRRKVDRLGLKQYSIDLMSKPQTEETLATAETIQIMAVEDLQRGTKFQMKVWDANGIYEESISEIADLSKLPQRGDPVRFNGKTEAVIAAKLMLQVKPPSGYSRVYVDVLVDAE